MLTTEPVNIDGCFKKLLIQDRFHLYYHIDLEFTTAERNDQSLVLLGNLYDPENYESTNEDILNHLVNFDFDTIIEKSFIYAGRFILIYCNKTDLKLFNDPVGLRKVYHTHTGQGDWCASQPHLLAELLGIRESDDPLTKAFYQSEQFKLHEASGVLDRTIFKEIALIKANHYLNILNGKLIRFWPDKRLQRIPKKEAAILAGDLLKNYIQSIAHRNQIMVPVTAGIDSRMILAATVDIKDKVYYYVNKISHLTMDSNDIKVPVKLAKKLGIDFHIHEVEPNVDKDFETIIYKNCKYALPEHISWLYHIYYKKFPSYINLPGGFSEVARDQFKKLNHKYSGQELANMFWYKGNTYVIDTYNKWIHESNELTAKYGIHVNDLFYWEERLGTWGSVYQQYKDIAQEEIWPFNSRYLMYIMLSTATRLRDEQTCKLQYAIVRYLWKDALSVGINPSFRYRLKVLSKHTGVFNIFSYLGLAKNF